MSIKKFIFRHGVRSNAEDEEELKNWRFIKLGSR
jgi:hypothetical protein